MWLVKDTKSVPKYERRHSIHGNGTYLCPLSVDWQVPVDASHTLMVLSLLALAILPPQGEKDTDVTQSLLKNTKLVPNYKRRHSIKGNGSYLCPLRGDPMAAPVAASHNRTELSLLYPSPLHDAMTLPFGEKTTQWTPAE